MRYGIASDIHGNLEALTAVIEHLEGVDAIVCPGDIVGYGADPDACCDLIRERSSSAVVGNHDAAVTGQMDLSWFNPAARTAALWTREQLSVPNKLYLDSLPPIKRLTDFLLVHATPAEPLGFNYINTTWEARPAFAEMNENEVCFIGHSHIAEYYILPEGTLSPLHIALTNGGTIAIKEGSKYIINCGSVGQPRDGNPLASFGIFDTDTRTVEVRRVEYDISTAQKKILDAGLPPTLASRLTLGH